MAEHLKKAEPKPQQHLKKATPEQTIARLAAELAVEKLKSIALQAQLDSAHKGGVDTAKLAVKLSFALANLINGE